MLTGLVESSGASTMVGCLQLHRDHAERGAKSGVERVLPRVKGPSLGTVRGSGPLRARHRGGIVTQRYDSGAPTHPIT